METQKFAQKYEQKKQTLSYYPKFYYFSIFRLT